VWLQCLKQLEQSRKRRHHPAQGWPIRPAASARGTCAAAPPAPALPTAQGLWQTSPGPSKQARASLCTGSYSNIQARARGCMPASDDNKAAAPHPPNAGLADTSSCFSAGNLRSCSTSSGMCSGCRKLLDMQIVCTAAAAAAGVA